MNWIAQLCDLYEKNRNLAGIMKEGKPVLLPIYHTTVTAQITVTIDEEGNFLRAEPVAETDKLTIIPVTDKSASRTAGKEPHPLCDNLEYLAGDYGSYVTEKDCDRKHELYMAQLKRWADSPYNHSKVKAIYRYLQKDSLIKDLCDCQILKLDDDGRLSSKVKFQTTVTQEKAFVRFCVEPDAEPEENILEDESGRHFAECWKDRTLQECYIAYYDSLGDNEGLSYLSGKRMQISYLQPKKIRNEGDGAKLISSNDESNYTFRGRFSSKEEAFAIGYEDSQKAHNALKWIIRKQGVNYDSLCLVTWESDLQPMPDWQADSDTNCSYVEKMDEEVDLEDDETALEAEEEYRGTGEAAAARFRSALKGYARNLEQSSRTVIMAFDAATTGRLSMVEFKDFASSRYLQALEDWYKRCNWRHPKSSKERGKYAFDGMVSIKDAAELLYGTEQKGYFSLKGKEERYKDVAKRWLPCILEGKEVPEDMVRLAVQRASSPVSFDSRFLWERILSLACSLVRQQYIKKNKGDWTMALDVTCSERDYLYGRLLALADRIEYRTYDKDDGRETNAKRYMCAFSQHPFRTWKVLEEKLEPYLIRLSVPERLTYQRMMDEIYNQFSIGAFGNDAPLSGLYLIGFHNQAYALREKKKEEED